MEACRDYSSVATDASNNNASLEYSIVHSPPFTFLVGPKHTKLTVQSGLARHVSKPLDHLMNSGQTRESKHHIAVLEDEDVETFVAFCEYAYTGDYNVPPPGSREDDMDQEVEFPDRKPSLGGYADIGAGLHVSPTAVSYLPSPPRSAGTEEKDQEVRPASEGSQVVDNEHQLPETGQEIQNSTAVDSAPMPDPESAFPDQSETAAPTAPEGTDPWDFADAAPSKGKKGKKSKKSKKNVAADPTPKFTPPSTPPPGTPGQPAADMPAEPDDWAQPLESNPADHDGDEPDSTVPPSADGWESTASPPAMAAPVPETDDGDADKEVHDDQPGDGAMGPIIDTSFAKQHFAGHHENGISMWDEFATLDYIDPRQWSSGMTRPPSVLSHASRTADLPYLVFHAKVYVFAARYLIPALAQLCLRKLHRDLVNLGFPDGDGDSHAEGVDEDRDVATTKAKMVLDLLHYTYSRTTRLEPISPTSATQLRDNELRKLVVHYAACKVRDLAEACPPMEGGFAFGDLNKASSRGMRTLLDTTPELASDLVYRMMM